MFLDLNTIKTYLGIGGVTYPLVTVPLTIDVTAETITRTTGNWNTDLVSVGSMLVLAGFTDAGNNVKVAVSQVVSNTVIKFLGPVGMADGTGPTTSFNQDDISSITTYDTFLNSQGEVVTEAIEGYCGRIFMEDTYTQSFYADELEERVRKELYLYHYPVKEVTAIQEDSLAAITSPTELAAISRLSKPAGILIKTDGSLWFSGFDKLAVTYTAGYATLPATIQHVYLSIIEANYNKKVAGVDINFGRDVQRISIPGALSIDFDYTLDANERKNAFGSILNGYLNILDNFRNERVLTGEIGRYYDS